MGRQPSAIPVDRAYRRDVATSFLLVLVVIAVVVAAIMAAFYTHSRTMELTRLQSNGLNALELQEQLIKRIFMSVTSDVLFLAGQNELGDFIRTGDPALCNHIADEYLRFCTKKHMYDQVRFIAVDGSEIVRVDYNNGSPTVIPHGELQSRPPLSYFYDLLSLEPDEVYVSQFDLNKENGKIVKPVKPVIRFGVAVYDDAGEHRGYVVLNFLGERLFELIKEAEEGVSEGSVMLANRDGYLLYGPISGQLWGSVIDGRDEFRMSNLYPSTWPTIKTQPRGAQYTPDGLFLYNTVEPLDTKALAGHMQYSTSNENDSYYWKIIAHIHRDTLRQQASAMGMRYILLWIAFVIMSAFPAWIAATMIVRRKLDRQRLFRMAHYDGLTGLPNRSLFYDRLEQTIQLSRRYNRSFAILYMDLDGFKNVNDTLGHDNGDLMLQVIASRLQSCVRASDTVARMGGDEFTVLLTTIAEPADAALVAGKIRDFISQPADLSGTEQRITISIGISLFPGHGDNPEILIKRADASMYEAKVSGKNAFRFYR